MLKKYSVALLVALATVLLLIGTMVYPGGSRFDKNSVGFDWAHNYITNLFGATAVNGSNNPSRLWAASGMFFLATSFGIFYYQFSKRIPSRHGANIIRYAGISSAICMFLVVTPYHDAMITIEDVLSLLSIFYITVFVFKTKLHFHKIVCCICLLDLYLLTFIYYSGYFLNILPVMQKINFGITVTWMLLLQYFSTAESFKATGNKL